MKLIILMNKTTSMVALIASVIVLGTFGITSGYAEEIPKQKTPFNNYSLTVTATIEGDKADRSLLVNIPLTSLTPADYFTVKKGGTFEIIRSGEDQTDRKWIVSTDYSDIDPISTEGENDKYKIHFSSHGNDSSRYKEVTLLFSSIDGQWVIDDSSKIMKTTLNHELTPHDAEDFETSLKDITAIITHDKTNKIIFSYSSP